MICRAAAEAIFGSLSRGDGDALSDRDILLVDDNTEVLKHRGVLLESAGYSVASYTFRKLDALAERGALFIQHLKDEANILRDNGGRLSAKLAKFRPKKSYAEEISENAYLARLASEYPNTGPGALWAADVLYVATRNFGVLWLAEKGVYVFSYSQVLQALAQHSVIMHSAIPDLLRLRWAKSSHRSHKRISPNTARDVIDRALSTLTDFSFPAKSRAVAPIETLLNLKELPGGMPAYFRLRNLERAYIALMAVCPTPVNAGFLLKLTRCIENPRAYASLARVYEHEFMTEIRRSTTQTERVCIEVAADGL
jgi:hypothetical protein